MVLLPHFASAYIKARRILLAGVLGLATVALGAAPVFAGHAPDSFADLAAKVSDAVVNISATQTYEEKDATSGSDVDPGTPFDDLFER